MSEIDKLIEQPGAHTERQYLTGCLLLMIVPLIAFSIYWWLWQPKAVRGLREGQAEVVRLDDGSHMVTFYSDSRLENPADLEGVENLTQLSISVNLLDDAALTMLSKLNLPTLKRLRVFYRDGPSSPLVRFSPEKLLAFAKQHSIRELVFSDVAISTDVLAELNQIPLDSLTISGERFNNPRLTWLEGPVQFSTLDISRTHVNNEGLKSIVKMPGLKRLVALRTDIQINDVRRKEILSENPTLEEILLSADP